MRLPPLSHPTRYVGLFAIDFGEWVSAGFTAEEVQTLLATPQFALAKAYRIHRVDQAGRVELTGWEAGQLGREEFILLACPTAEIAAANFDTLRRHAETTPPPSLLTIELADWADRDPPHIVSLRYAQHASPQISGWLGRVRLEGDTTPAAGSAASSRPPTTARIIATHAVVGPAELAPRSKEELLRTVRQPVQR